TPGRYGLFLIRSRVENLSDGVFFTQSRNSRGTGWQGHHAGAVWFIFDTQPCGKLERRRIFYTKPKLPRNRLAGTPRRGTSFFFAIARPFPAHPSSFKNPFYSL
ncbi:hypothetical protein, partial [Ferruginibacter sp. HRS2-29]|uniref:hypothetical protein n=1 Tax=Ferruginibacter sp. HRS2-29 TaxID=2487334 RepID=UPI0020CD05FE